MSLRTNLTVRELAAVVSISKSQIQRIIADLVPRLAAIFEQAQRRDLRRTWIVDGTLVPTRDHGGAAKSKNYRWSCNVQVLVRHDDRSIVAVAGGGPGNRNDTVHYRGSVVESLCRQHRRVLADGGYRGVAELITPRFRANRIVRDHVWRRHRKRRARVEHAIARLKNWRVLRDHRRRAGHVLVTVQAVAYLHNLTIQLRDNSQPHQRDGQRGLRRHPRCTTSSPVATDARAMTTILHVEDDLALAEMVSEAFAAFGFRGPMVLATTVSEAREILADIDRYPRLDLIISDMHLPDGCGLDVVQSVRSHPVRSEAPILILSGDTDPDVVSRAYALGANSYISKGTRQRSVAESLRALHDHWLQDARLPSTTPAARTHHLVATSARVQMRKARLHMQLAELLGSGVPEADFWMDLALREGNLANLISFLLGQLDNRELSEDSIVELSAMQVRETQLLDKLEQHPLRTQEEVDRLMYTVLANYCDDAPALARATSQLFPIVPVAMATLVAIGAGLLEGFAAWVEKYATDSKRRELIPRLRAGAKQLRDVSREPSRAQVASQ